MPLKNKFNTFIIARGRRFGKTVTAFSTIVDLIKLNRLAK